MNTIYESFLNGHKRFGTSKEQVGAHALKCDISLIKENVIIAPTMRADIFKNLGASIDTIYDKYHILSNIKINDLEFTFITTGIGAPNVVDIVLALGVKQKKNLLFIGSVGSLDKNIDIGSIVIPDYSICGDGVCRYLTGKSLKDSDTFGEKYYPNLNLYNLVCESSKSICEKHSIPFFTVHNFSIDNIFTQYSFIDEILNLGSQVIEMETASVFRASELCGINSAAIFHVSDNTITNKSLYSGRSPEDKAKKGYSRYVVTPEILLNVLNKLSK